MTQFPQLNTEGLTTDIILHTNHGDIEIALFEEQAPKTVENFKGLAKKGYYDGVIFHRIIKDFMIQGGDPTGTGMGGESIWGSSFEDEFSSDLFNLYGALSMANAGPHTNGSQFFIVTAPQVAEDLLDQMKEVGFPKEVVEAYQKNGGTPWLDHRHTVFGQVVKGMEHVLEIQALATDANDKPLEDVVIQSVTLTDE